MTDLQINVRRDGSTCVVRLSGTCDLATVPALRQELVPLAPPEVTRLVLEVHDLEFCDSTGLGTMLGSLRRMKEGGGEMVISGARGTMRRLLEITGVDAVVPMI